MKIRYILFLVGCFILPTTALIAQPDSQNTYGGVGALLTRELSGYVRVDDVAPGGPAELAGLKKNDLIIAVGDSLVTQQFLVQVVGMLKGPIGTFVSVRVIRQGKQFTARIRRDSITPWVKQECIEGDCNNGFGKMKGLNGDIYEGNYVDGLPEGDFVQRRPTGEIIKVKYEKGKQQNLNATIYYSDNRVYVGSINEGVPHGRGTLTFADGSTRTGSWFLGRLEWGCLDGNCENGEGSFIDSDGNIYNCSFRDRLRHGMGTIKFSVSVKDVDSFTGRFENNEIVSGQLIYRNGDRYEGEVMSPYFMRIDGCGKMFYANGDIYEGQWGVDGWSGNGTLLKKDGTRYVGRFKDGKKDGWMVLNKAGKLSMHVYNEGVINQPYQAVVDSYFTANKLPSEANPLFQQYALAREIFGEGCLFGDCQNGIGISFFTKFMRQHVYYGDFKNGKPDGIGELHVYDFEDPRTYQGPFKDGELHGMIRYLSDTGKRLPRIFYKGKAEAIGWSSMEQFEQKLAEEMEEIKKEFEARKNDKVGFIYSDDDGGSSSSGGSSNDSEPWRVSSYDVCNSGDCMNEYSRIHFGNGDYYYGEMKNGRFHGKGQYKYFATNFHYFGQFENGDLQGEGVMHDNLGNRLVATWENSVPTSGTAYNSDGCKVYVATFNSEGKIASFSYRSSTCEMTSNEPGEKVITQYYAAPADQDRSWTQETIYSNKGTRNESSVTIPVRKYLYGK